MGDKKKGFFGRLVEGLTKTRDSIVSGIDSVFSGFSAIDDDFYEEIEETLIMGDLRYPDDDGDRRGSPEKGKRKPHQGSGRVQGSSDCQHQGTDGSGRKCLRI